MRRDDRAEIERRLRALAGSRGEPDGAPPAAPCPSGDILDRYRRGMLEPEEARELAYHLLRCPNCAREVLVREEVERRADRAAARSAAPILRPFASFGNVLRGRQALAGLGVFATAAAILLFFLVGRLHHEVISDATIVGERGLVRGEGATILRGEGFGLTVRLREAAAILVLLEMPDGAIDEIYPAGESPAALGKGAWRLPPDEGAAWDSSGLEPGRYALWVISPRTPQGSGVERAEEILADIVRKAAKTGAPEAERIREARDALRGLVAEVHRIPFRIER
ncbi:MAG: hypothetical protein JXP34_01665 [Planctomycetes bacterium]|nr:hypothetical protein [Planctomycetota bacterium]